MKTLFTSIAFIATLVPLQTAASSDLLARMAAVNPGLHSYQVSMKAHVALTTFPFLSADLAGTYYHKDPDLDKLEITSGLPAIASGFSKLYPHLEPPSRWPQVFDVKIVNDDGKTAQLTLVPKNQGNVQSVDARVDDATATVQSLTWHYAGGGTATMNNTYKKENGYELVTSQTGSVDESSYKGTINSTLSGYKLNPQLSDSIFQQ